MAQRTSGATADIEYPHVAYLVRLSAARFGTSAVLGNDAGVGEFVRHELVQGIRPAAPVPPVGPAAGTQGPPKEGLTEGAGRSHSLRACRTARAPARQLETLLRESDLNGSAIC